MKITEERVKKILSGDLNELNKIFEEQKVEIIETVLRSIPAMVGRLVEYTAGVHGTVTQFYKDNPAYQKHKEIVAKTIQEVEQKNPGMGIDDLLKEALPTIDQKIAALKTSVRSDISVEDIQGKFKEGMNGAI